MPSLHERNTSLQQENKLKVYRKTGKHEGKWLNESAKRANESENTTTTKEKATRATPR